MELLVITLLLIVFVLAIVTVALSARVRELQGRVDCLSSDSEEFHRDQAQLRRAIDELAASRAAAPPPPPAPAQTPSTAPAAVDYSAAEAELFDPAPTSGMAESTPTEPGGSDTAEAAPGGGPSADDTGAEAQRVWAESEGKYVPAPVAAGHRAKAPPTAAVDARPRALSLEDFLGGRVLLVAGVIIVLFALGFFLKFAIDRELIAPPFRVAIGCAGGVAALFIGDRMRARGFAVFAHAVMGGGLGALLISTFFAAARYEMIGQIPAFGITAAICALGTAVAISREAPLLAYLGLLGGYLAPYILGSNTDALEGLTGWLLLLHGGVLAVLWLRRWPGLDLLALASSCIYYAAWADRFLTPDREGAAAVALASLTLAILALALAPAILRGRSLGPTTLVTAILTGTISASAGFELFYDDHRHALGGGLIALALVYITAAWRARQGGSKSLAGAPVLDGCGVAALAAAVPAILESGAIAPAWAAAGVVAAFLAARQRLAVVAAGGVVVIALAEIHLFSEQLPVHTGPFVPFVNGPFFAWASPAVALVLSGLILRWTSPWRTLSGLCLGAGAWLYAPLLLFEVFTHFSDDPARYGAADDLYAAAGGLSVLGAYTIALALTVRERRDAAILVPLGPLALLLIAAAVMLSFIDRPGFVPMANALFPAGLIVVAATWTSVAAARGSLRVALLVAAVAAGLGLIGTECVAYVENSTIDGTTREALERTALMASSIATALYGAGLLVAGFVRSTAALRWCGLAVFTLTIAKVFVVDMAELPTLHRVGGFLVLGLALLGASFLYQRARRTGEGDQ